jgi:hypothetical protein
MERSSTRRRGRSRRSPAQARAQRWRAGGGRGWGPARRPRVGAAAPTAWGRAMAAGPGRTSLRCPGPPARAAGRPLFGHGRRWGGGAGQRRAVRRPGAGPHPGSRPPGGTSSARAGPGFRGSSGANSFMVKPDCPPASAARHVPAGGVPHRPGRLGRRRTNRERVARRATAGAGPGAPRARVPVPAGTATALGRGARRVVAEHGRGRLTLRARRPIVHGVPGRRIGQDASSAHPSSGTPDGQG